jgi:hypothetical protein
MRGSRQAWGCEEKMCMRPEIVAQSSQQGVRVSALSHYYLGLLDTKRLLLRLWRIGEGADDGRSAKVW